METVDVVQKAFESSEISATVNTSVEERRGECHAGTCQHLGQQQKDKVSGGDKSPQFAFHTHDISMFHT